ncbi:MAG: glycerol kinase GlpK [Natrialbaceae archaeon]|nr:glycerol kinase GlpK [Natrialbaceae archaeon]
MRNDRFVGAIDQGTTGTRFLLFDRSGSVVCGAYATHEQHYPRPGWVEHDPMEIWSTTKQVIREALASGGIDAESLAAIGITNQRETALIWDADTGEPLHNAIVWQDRRTTERIESLEDIDWIRERTGLEPDAYFSATKLEWLLDEIPDGRARAQAGELRAGTIDTWLIEGLTGAHVTDVTNASRTMLFDIHALDWDEELLAEFNVPRAILPQVRPSSDPTGYGVTDEEGVLECEVPVTAALGDQQAALFGQTCFEAGEAKVTHGTGSFLLLSTGSKPVSSDHGLLTTVAFQVGGEAPTYALEGSIFSTGAAIEWLCDVGLLESAEASEALAGGVETTDGVYVVPAFTGLGAPHWDGRARGTIVGLTRGTSREHLIRATLESVAFQTRDVLTAMEADANLTPEVLRVDGGAAANDLLCQRQADLVSVSVERPVVGETTALGAAYAAGLAVDYWDGLEALRRNRAVDQAFEVQLDAATAADRHERWLEAVDRSRDWAQS